MFSVNDAFWLKADCPVRVNPLSFEDCTKVPLSVLPLPLLLPEGTLNNRVRPFSPVRFEMLTQPAPEHAAEAVVKVPPVSTPLVVTPPVEASP